MARLQIIRNRGMSHQQMVDYASELANEWLAQSLSDRIAAAENTEQDT